MRNEHERGHQEYENCSTVFRIPVNFPRHPDEAQQSSRFQQTNQRGCLKGYADCFVCSFHFFVLHILAYTHTLILFSCKSLANCAVSLAPTTFKVL